MSPKPQTAAEYHEILKKFAEKKGLIYNPDDRIVLPLIDGLFANKTRMGYPSCPCRLAVGEMEADKDIICPCDYAPPDIAEFGKCYCELYVSQDYIEAKIDQAQRVPERRPAEKMPY
jgi:ferredoxin-thioredoxin reductase catalytic subunit